MARLHVLTGGEGPVVLLLHGIGSSATAWSRQIERLKTSFRCIAPDLPGYGESPDPERPVLAAIVEDVSEVLAGQRAHVVGVSFGALVALDLARARPELVDSLVLVDATLGRANSAESDRSRWLAQRERLARDLGALSMERAAEIAGPGASAEVVEEIARHMRRARPTGYMTVARAIANTDARPWLGEVRQRALVMCGELDQVTGLEVSLELCQALPSATFLAIEGAGHAPHIEQPERFAQAIEDFLLMRKRRTAKSSG